MKHDFAITPGFLKLPPSLFLLFLTFYITFLVLTTIDPIGEPNPLLKQNITESIFLTSYLTSIL